MSGTIKIIGLGAGGLQQLTVGIYHTLKDAKRLYLRTEKHPVIEELKGELSFHTFDAIYESHSDFHSVYEEIVDELVRESKKGDLVYAVPGHPMVAEKTVQLLLEKARTEEASVEVVGGQSFIDPLFSALGIDPIEGFYFCDAVDLEGDQLPLTSHMVICQVYDAYIASEVKLTLMEKLPAEYEVVIAKSVGNSDQELLRVPLYELDRQVEVDNLTSVYVPPIEDERLLHRHFSYLRQVIKTLRSPEGCPWDRKQTHESLRKYLIEEAYEVISAIDEQDDDHLVEELGDVLLQVLLHAQIGEDEGYFDISDVIKGLTEKMIRRHPHVFGDETAQTADEVRTRWEEIKKIEQQGQPQLTSIFSELEKGLPPLIMAHDIQKEAAKIGFDWPEKEMVWNKIYEELEECRQEVEKNDSGKLERELGDVLFSIVNLARVYAIDPSIALNTTNQKFMKRFKGIERVAHESGQSLHAMSLEEMDQIWENMKEK
ncbi:tetrapyrrole methylase family protein/MazG family protein [Pullulanibacillus pueri]|uniref:Nucleoside triphosphate pyrophosphohydrolase n=1 Tax=Pullulanibacillus pueri TaxID=1437324 RepID=A0A8J3ENH4_9BACL|nr:nucleoside triphosphate pyrophosphohydrolase [Pullulanibacillus pueri]MBM7683944.1 tetrapyrrole methylase family protein/MazG family protein [Pullulanibacillus pueri]GGH88008.1 hypothetical protein GCM10007096_39340 [Pullulanibacillus pueri]